MSFISMHETGMLICELSSKVKSQPLLSSWQDAFGRWKDRASGRGSRKTSQEALAVSGPDGR